MISLRYPPHILFGRGVLNQLADEALVFGKEAMLVTGRTAMRKAGILDKVQEMFFAKKMSIILFDEVEHDPSLETVNRGLEIARAENISVVIGLGGGSAIDVAKSIAIVAPKQGYVQRYFYEEAPIDSSGIPLIAMPTTAGTGAEITNNSVLVDPERKRKRSLRSPHMIARVAIIDPELTLFCPPLITAYAGIDAFTQAIECFVSKTANSVTDSLALRAVKILYENLPLAVSKGNDIEIREKVALGSLFQAMAFSNAGVGAVHGLAHPLGAYYDIPHGLACGILLPHILEVNIPACRDKVEIMAKELGVNKADDLPDRIKELLHKVNLPLDFKKWQIKIEDIPVLVRDSRSGSMSKNPKDLSEDDLACILKKLM